MNQGVKSLPLALSQRNKPLKSILQKEFFFLQTTNIYLIDASIFLPVIPSTFPLSSPSSSILPSPVLALLSWLLSFHILPQYLLMSLIILLMIYLSLIVYLAPSASTSEGRIKRHILSITYTHFTPTGLRWDHLGRERHHPHRVHQAPQHQEGRVRGHEQGDRAAPSERLPPLLRHVHPLSLHPSLPPSPAVRSGQPHVLSSLL